MAKQSKKAPDKSAKVAPGSSGETPEKPRKKVPLNFRGNPVSATRAARRERLRRRS